MSYKPRKLQGQPEPFDLPRVEDSLNLQNPNSELRKQLINKILELAHSLSNATVANEAGLVDKFKIYFDNLNSNTIVLMGIIDEEIIKNPNLAEQLRKIKLSYNKAD
jgi:hypothetical protein